MRTVFSPLRASAGALLLVLTYCGGDDVAAPTAGSLTVSAPTSGAVEPIPDYSVIVDLDPGVALHPNGSITITGLTEGAHVVRLDDVPVDCTVSGDNPRTAAVTAGGTASTSFEISCIASQSLEITTSTIGDLLDPDGYLVSIDAQPGVPVQINGVTTITGLASGTHSVLLSGIAENCEPQQDNPAVVTAEAGATTSLSLEVACRAVEPAEGVILFQSQRRGRQHIFRMQEEGSGITDLTPDSDGEDGVISPGGTRIAFSSHRSGNQEIYLMAVDGGHAIPITENPEDDTQPAWSPDGSKIAFASNGGGGGTEVWVMNADGTGATQITTGGGFQPSWSPDGRTIAFSRVVKLCLELFEVCSVHIFVVPATGGTATDISGRGDKLDHQPAWSPDGTTIAFEENRTIWVMEADGSGRVQLTGENKFVQDFGPVWSPDGSKIAFQRILGTGQIFVMNADGSNPFNLSNNSESEAPTSWR
jgi:hypothetical protein